MLLIPQVAKKDEEEDDEDVEEDTSMEFEKPGIYMYCIYPMITNDYTNH